MSKKKRIIAQPSDRSCRAATKQLVVHHLARIDYVIAECQRIRALLEPVAGWANGKGELPESVTHWAQLAERVYRMSGQVDEAASRKMTRFYHSHFRTIGDVEGALDEAVEEVFEAAAGSRVCARDAA
jgi:hypothetical protein